MALGALIGGLLLAGTEYRRQVEVTIEPFKGLFVGVFLISIGMGLDIRIVGAAPWSRLRRHSGVPLLKLLIVVPLARAFGLKWAEGLHTGLLLGPGGEFGFVIVAAAIGERLLDPETASDGAVRDRPDDGNDPAAVRAGRSARAAADAEGGGRPAHAGAGCLTRRA